MELIRLANRDNYRQIEEEWRFEFVYFVLEKIGIPHDILTGCFPDEINDLGVEHKIELRKHMSRFDVSIVDDLDGGIKIYVEQQLVAEWKKCKFVLKEDLKEVNPSKRLYMELHGDVWTIFDVDKEDDG